MGLLQILLVYVGGPALLITAIAAVVLLTSRPSPRPPGAPVLGVPVGLDRRGRYTVSDGARQEPERPSTSARSSEEAPAADDSGQGSASGRTDEGA